MANESCDLLHNGAKCGKWDKRNACKPSTVEWLEERMWQCDVNQMCRESSIFGNNYFYLTDEDIEALKSGKILYFVDEYGTFIGYNKGE